MRLSAVGRPGLARHADIVDVVAPTEHVASSGGDRSPVDDLVDRLGRLPGIGPKSASKIAHHIMSIPATHARRLADAITSTAERMGSCPQCFSSSVDGLECRVCADLARDRSVLCVVEDHQGVAALERTHSYRGLYHVLGGVFSPIDGIGVEDLRVAELRERVAAGGVAEVILATNPTIEGDITAVLLHRELSSFDIKITRIACGLPAGGDLDLADEVTLERAIAGRSSIQH